MDKISGIQNYSTFVKQLNSDFKAYPSLPKEEWMESALKAVDGFAAEELRRLVNLETRRKFGAFFTPSELGKKVVDEIFPNLNEDSIIYDPACGAGNLLLNIFDYIHEKGIVPKNKQFLFGTDIHPEFVAAANCRLEIKQFILRSKDGRKYKKRHYIVEKRNGLTGNRFYNKATHILVNPPFNLTLAPKEITWAEGIVSSAALFIDHIIRKVKPGTIIVAILPDVLRSGTRYDSWREMVLTNCTNEKVKLLGQFDKHADVDVFAIRLKKRGKPVVRKNKTNQLQLEKKANKTIQDKFSVCVGPVVDNRDENLGRRRGYIVSKGLPGWSVQNEFNQLRNHQGKCFKGPFIVIKRTSRMGDKQRAIATIINTPHPVFVDNHLIVLIPKNGKISTCKKALKILKDPRTNTWLNKTIRCRHLTVKSVSKIPMWP